MVIGLKQLYNIVGESRDFDYTISNTVLDDYNTYTFSSPVSVKGRLTNRAGVLMLDYSADFTLLADCDKCLLQFERDYSFEFGHILVKALSNYDNDDYIVTENDELALDELVVSDILLQLPTKMLCKEDCKGLCMHCGTDLNVGQCDCSIQIS